MFPALKRIYEAAECGTQAQLAELLQVSQPSIAEVARRGSIPAKWLMQLLRLRGISPDWILTGEGSRCLGPVKRPPEDAGGKRNSS